MTSSIERMMREVAAEDVAADGQFALEKKTLRFRDSNTEEPIVQQSSILQEAAAEVESVEREGAVSPVVEDAYDDDYEDEHTEQSNSKAVKNERVKHEGSNDSSEDEAQRKGKNILEKKVKKKNYEGSVSEDSGSEDVDEGGLDDSDLQLQLRCFHGDVSGLERLLEKMKDPKAIFRKDRHGWTTLHWAARKGRKDIIEMLIKYSKIKTAKLVNSSDMIVGWTPLHLACVGGHIDCIQVLVENGASNSIKNKLEETPLDCLSISVSKKDRSFIEDVLKDSEGR